jgi:hypothetical protein
VIFIADQDAPIPIPQDRYDDDTELTADDKINDEGTASPTASPTMEATQKITVEATASPTPIDTDADGMDDPTNSPTALTTTETTTSATIEVTDEETTNATIEVTDASTSGDDDYYGGDRRMNNSGDSVIDVIFFHEPSSCVKTNDGCDWMKLGVGSSDNFGNVHWCCSELAVELQICEPSNVGRLIIDETLFHGEHRPVSILLEGNYQASVQVPVMKTNEGTGQYSLVLANCNNYGRGVLVEGEYIWKSKGGYLPGNLFEEWKFFTFFTVAYGVLLAWYGRSMKQNKDSIIGIQKWILCAIVLGLIELVFKGIDYMEWNHRGTRIDGVMYLCKYCHPITINHKQYHCYHTL